MIAAAILTCLLFIAIAVGVSVCERPKRNRRIRRGAFRDAHGIVRYRKWVNPYG